MLSSKKMKGQSVVEYGLIIALISLAVIASLTLLGNNLKDNFLIIGSALDVEEEQEQEEEIIHNRNYFFIFSYTEEGVILGFSRNVDGVDNNLVEINFGTRRDLQNLIGDDIQLPTQDGNIKFDYNEVDDTLTTSVNGSTMKTDSFVNSTVKTLFKTIINIFGW